MKVPPCQPRASRKSPGISTLPFRLICLMMPAGLYMLFTPFPNLSSSAGPEGGDLVYPPGPALEKNKKNTMQALKNVYTVFHTLPKGHEPNFGSPLACRSAVSSRGLP